MVSESSGPNVFLPAGPSLYIQVSFICQKVLEQFVFFWLMYYIWMLDKRVLRIRSMALRLELLSYQ